jgi:uncharacterized protein involved in exopolysaccharide biosynthesis
MSAQPEAERTVTQDSRNDKPTVLVKIKPDDGPTNSGLYRPEPRVDAHLLVMIGANVGFQYDVSGLEYTIGRSEHADIHLDDDRVAGLHAHLVKRGHGHRIYDRTAKRGVLVNSQRVDEIDLRDGDVVQIGYTVFRYRQGAPTSLSPRAAYEQRMPGPVHAHAGAPAALVEEELTMMQMIEKGLRLLKMLRPYGWLIALLAVLGIGAGAASFALRPPAQSASFEIMLVPHAADNPVREPGQNSTIEFFHAAEQSFRSVGLIQKTLEALHVEDRSDGRLTVIRNNLQFFPIGALSANTYTGIFTSTSPDDALTFLTKHAQLYVDTEIEKTIRVIRVQRDFLQTELATVENDLKASETALSEFKRTNLAAIPEQARESYDNAFDARSRLSAAIANLERTRTQLRLDSEKLAGEQPMKETRDSSTRPYDAEIAAVNAKIAEGRANGLGDVHPDMVSLKAKLASLKTLSESPSGSIKSGSELARNTTYDQLSDSVHKLKVAEELQKRDVERARAEVARASGAADKLPQVEQSYAELTRKFENLKTLQAKLADNLKQAQLQLDLERASASARYDMITPPRVEFISVPKAVGKRMATFGILGLVAGLGVAVLLAFRKEYLRQQMIGY